jgi:hypothetical protein
METIQRPPCRFGVIPIGGVAGQIPNPFVVFHNGGLIGEVSNPPGRYFGVIIVPPSAGCGDIPSGGAVRDADHINDPGAFGVVDVS